MKRFFAIDIQGQNAILSDEESHHCLQVLRTKDGEPIEIIDGKGNLWNADIQIFNKKSYTITLNDLKHSEPISNVHCSLAVALTKNIDRIEWMLEKCTELGLKDFYPLITHRTERKQARMDRLEKIVISATKQSERLWTPTLHEPMDFKSFMRLQQSSSKYIGHCIDEQEKNSFSEIYSKNEDALILIGPEGDFTEEEIQTALENGYQAVSLGSSRLRVETAALAACAWINLR